MAAGGVCFFVGGAVRGSVSKIGPAFTSQGGLVAVILMVPAMFVGFDILPQMAEEMNLSLRGIAKIMVLSIGLAAAWYIAMIIGIAMAAPAAVRDSASIPVADAFAYAMGHTVFGKLMIITAICGILTSWNGFIVGASRVLFSMGRAKMLPEIFGRVHPTYRSPSAAIALVGLITCFSPLLGRSALVWFVDASAFGTVTAYFMVVLAFLFLRRREPALHRPYRIKHGGAVGLGAVAVSVFFLCLYLPIGPGALGHEEWIMVFAWLGLGVALYILSRVKYGAVSRLERENLTFGEEYARK
jgi:amino acid transporter